MNVTDLLPPSVILGLMPAPSMGRQMESIDRQCALEHARRRADLQVSHRAQRAVQAEARIRELEGQVRAQAEEIRRLTNLLSRYPSPTRG